MRYRGPRRTVREWLYDFMLGRNGLDSLAKFASALALFAVIINLFFEHYSLAIVALILLGYTIFRILSKNIYKRQKENSAYLALIKRMKDFFALQRAKWRDRKTHVYRKCPSCKKVLRLPKKKGEHTVNCPVCHNKFNLKI